jgi:hypothetical protein
MLAYKAWRESQVRFLLGAAALGWFCGVFVVFRSGIRDGADKAYPTFIVDAIYAGGIRNLYVMFVIVLGLGGLLQERARGTAGFTLALPRQRARHVAVRAAIGLGEVAGLASMPTLAVMLLSPLMREAYPLDDALRFSAQWAAGGAVLFAGSFLLSVVLAGPYSALASSMAALLAYSLLVKVSVIRRFPSLNVFSMMGSPQLPVVGLVGAVLVTIAVVAFAAWMTEQQDF